MKHIAGSKGPYLTGRTVNKSDKSSTVLYVEGPISTLMSLNPDDLCPGGLTVESTTLSETGGGMGKLTINCIEYGDVNITTIPTRTTWRITMGEVQKDLMCHPNCVGDRSTIEKWLATELGKRYDKNNNPQWIDSEGTAHSISYESDAGRYIKAYEKGIETYNLYFPIIEKISIYKRLPGVSMNKNSTNSGLVSKFSSNLGTWNVPDLRIPGFSNAGWFKSGDNYEQGNDLVWTRTEQWTWTPDNGNDINWIYARS